MLLFYNYVIKCICPQFKIICCLNLCIFILRMEMQCHAHTNVHVRGGLEMEHEPGKRSCICGGGLKPQDI